MYNCIAFAAGKDDQWWWPFGYATYWPPNIPNEETLDAFIAAFSSLGYSPCSDGLLESGFEKVAIYTDPQGKPTHMAKQLDSSMWTSKCGAFEDIEHETLEALEGDEYGSVALFLKRPLNQ